MALISRYTEVEGHGVLDILDDGRSYCYFSGNRATETIIKVNSDDTTTLIMYPHADFDEIEAPSSNSNIDLASYNKMTHEQHYHWRLVIWFEFFWWNQVATMWQSNLSETRDIQTERLKGAMDSWYSDTSLTLLLATNLVDGSVKPKYNQIGLTDIPYLFVRLSTGE